MKLVVPILIAVAICVLAIRSLKSSNRSSVITTLKTDAGGASSSALVKPDSRPDGPVPFGYKCIWFAVKSTNSEDILTAIGLKSAVPSNWESGIKAAYKGQVFVSPPVNGWTLVVGQDLPTLDDPDRVKQVENLLIKLSDKFTEAHQYGTHRVVEYHSWAKAVDGKIVREYSYLGERGETLRNVGEKTEGEKTIGVGDGPAYMPDETVVMKVAEKWSLNPNDLNRQSAGPGTGWIGNL